MNRFNAGATSSTRIFAQRAKAARRKPGRRGILTRLVTRCDEPYLLLCEVDEHGVELDVPVQKRRDKAAAKRIFRRVLSIRPVPRKIMTDQLRNYPAAKDEIPQLASVKHVFVKAAARLTIASRTAISTGKMAKANGWVS